ncbi:UDP-N-acetylglucosamine 1-carboxyvinyltransferase [Candidatus Uhrbacteria bacterium]|nr:UDP-N-acetylglucosamine 1-carboxyvinyltransferase [Candidatus Uhrbacteria bacterium]
MSNAAPSLILEKKTAVAPVATRFVIRGGRHLSGDIKVGGMKNAATPILAATLLASEPCIIENVPRLSDVERMLDILRSLGAEAEWTGEHEVSIDARRADIGSLDAKAVKSMRSSVLLMGPLLARFHEVRMPEPGGCIIGNRPLDAHIAAFETLGAQVRRENGHYVLTSGRLKGATIILPEFSVTATENALMAAVLAEGRTVIDIAAMEPHVQDLCRFLVACGARIGGIGTHTLTIDGVERLGGARHRLIPDQIEAGTYAVLSALTKGRIVIRGVEPRHLDLVLLTLKNAGVRVVVEGGSLRTEPSSLKAFRRLQTLPYPGFPTDLQAPFGVLATQCSGSSLIQEPLYEGRFGYVNELVKMGANATVCDPHRVLISGPTPLYGQEIRGLDLRAGATLVIAGLVAQGETVIHGAEVIDRGYERLDERLRALGADIERVEA